MAKMRKCTWDEECEYESAGMCTIQKECKSAQVVEEPESIEGKHIVFIEIGNQIGIPVTGISSPTYEIFMYIYHIIIHPKTQVLLRYRTNKFEPVYEDLILPGLDKQFTLFNFLGQHGWLLVHDQDKRGYFGIMVKSLEKI